MLLDEIVDGDSNGSTCSRSIAVESADSVFFSVTVRTVNMREWRVESTLSVVRSAEERTKISWRSEKRLVSLLGLFNS